MSAKKKMGKIPHTPIQIKPKPVEMRGLEYYMAHAREYPYGTCWIDGRYKLEDGGMTQVMVTRIQPNGRLIFGIYVVDLFCLGVKKCAYNFDFSKSNFERKISQITDDVREEITPEYANGLIYGAIDFAAQYGCEPEPDFAQASLVLDPPGTYAPPEDVTYGKDGKPLYVAGPYDDGQKIMAQLSKAGEGNYDFLLPVEPPPGALEKNTGGNEEEWE